MKDLQIWQIKIVMSVIYIMQNFTLPVWPFPQVLSSMHISILDTCTYNWKMAPTLNLYSQTDYMSTDPYW